MGRELALSYCEKERAWARGSKNRMAREKRILVVEDDDAIRTLMFTVLRRHGFKVDASPNGAHAIDRFSRCVYSLVLLDLMMPVMTGYDFLAELEKREIAHRPLVFVLTAGGSTNSLPADVVTGSFRKPFDLDLLVDTISACLSTLEEPLQPDSCPVAESERINGRRRPEDPK